MPLLLSVERRRPFMYDIETLERMIAHVEQQLSNIGRKSKSKKQKTVDYSQYVQVFNGFVHKSVMSIYDKEVKI